MSPVRWTDHLAPELGLPAKAALVVAVLLFPVVAESAATDYPKGIS